MLLRDRAQFTAEGVVPDHLRVVPDDDSAVPSRVLQGQDSCVSPRPPHEAFLAMPTMIVLV